MELPPDKLLRRVGWYYGDERPREVFAQRGREQWRFIAAQLEARVGLAGRRVLDFGCGVGRILQVAVEESPASEFWGADIHGPSVEWLQGQLAGRAQVVRIEAQPPLQAPDSHFDAIYSMSVFTHVVDEWSAWLLELHRVLADDGVLLATVVGPGLSAFEGVPVVAERTGMNVLDPSDAWGNDGPWILHSEWWLRAHWGRAFEILDVIPGGDAPAPPLFEQAAVIMRKRPGRLTPEQLERVEPGEPREIAALQENVAQLRREIARHAAIFESASWRLTAPLRAAGELVRARRSGRAAR